MRGILIMAEESVGRAAARIIKDSGRYLLSGVKAALQAREPSTVLSEWRQSAEEPPELLLQAHNLSRLVQLSMARSTERCAEQRSDLLYEPSALLPTQEIDERRLGAALETMFCTAALNFGDNAGLAVVTQSEPEHSLIIVRTQGPSPEPEGLEQILNDPNSDLGVARAIVRAHGGEISLQHPNDCPLALIATLPLPEEKEEPAEA